MEFEVVNIKENSPSVDEAIATFEIALENAKKSGVKVLKVIHGYGSHGVGGAIILELKKQLPILKKQNKIKSYISGTQWNLANLETMKIIEKYPSCASDEDLHISNIGITIILL